MAQRRIQRLTLDDDSTECYRPVMARTISLRLSETAYEAVKRHAGHDQRSMNAWIEEVLDAEDMRRRCAAHHQHLIDNPHLATFAGDWADRNLDDMAR